MSELAEARSIWESATQMERAALMSRSVMRFLPKLKRYLKYQREDGLVFYTVRATFQLQAMSQNDASPVLDTLAQTVPFLPDVGAVPMEHANHLFMGPEGDVEEYRDYWEAVEEASWIFPLTSEMIRLGSNLDTREDSLDWVLERMDVPRHFEALLSDLRNLKFLAGTPLWNSTNASSNSSLKLRELTPSLNFFDRWFRTIELGNSLRSEVQREIALISKDDWEVGPERVAELIEVIEAKYRGGTDASDDAVAQEVQRSQTILTTHAEKLLDDGSGAEWSASGAAFQLTTSLDAYLNATGLNQVPEELLPIQSVASSLVRIADLSEHARLDTSPRDEIIAALTSELARYKLRLEAVEAELAAASSNAEKSEFWTAYKKTMGVAAATATVSVIGGTALYFLAPEHASGLARQLGDRLMSILGEGGKVPRPSTLPQIGPN